MSTAVSTETRRENNANEQEFELRRGPWTLEEDTLLIHYIACHGEGRWNLLAKCAGLKRTGKSCRLRWLNYLKPDIKRGNLTPQEQLSILELHSKLGNRWSKIAQHLPGRTDNEIKNYWRTRVQKQARQLKIESNSKRFLDAIRCLWMPRLLEQMEQTSSNSSSSSSLSTPSSYSAPPATTETQNYSTVITFSSLPDLKAPSALSSSSPTPNPPSKIVLESFNQPCENLSSVSDDSMGITELLEFPEHPTLSPAHAFGSSSTSTFLNDCNYVDMITTGYDMEEGFNLPSSTSALGPHYCSPLDGHVAGGHLVGNEVASTLWNNVDDLWQFRKPEGTDI